MKRDFNSNPDFNNNEDDEDEESLEGFVDASRQDIMDVMHLELVEKENNTKIMETAHKVAGANIFWSFYNDKTKLKRIEKIYRRLRRLAAEIEE